MQSGIASSQLPVASRFGDHITFTYWLPHSNIPSNPVGIVVVCVCVVQSVGNALCGQSAHCCHWLIANIGSCCFLLMFFTDIVVVVSAVAVAVDVVDGTVSGTGISKANIRLIHVFYCHQHNTYAE